jgi:hypothetical protein
MPKKLMREAALRMLPTTSCEFKQYAPGGMKCAISEMPAFQAPRSGMWNCMEPRCGDGKTQ